MAEATPNSETLQDFRALTEQYVNDMNQVYNTYMEERETLARQAVDSLMNLNEEFMKQSIQLSATYVKNLAHLPEGEHPEQHE